MVNKVIYDELDYYSVENEDTEEYNSDLSFEDLNILFDNSYANKLYVVSGIVGHWDGYHAGWFDWVAHSIEEAILKANDSYNGYIKVSEGKYGRLLLDINHHDGNNSLEIRELSGLGEKMFNNFVSVKKIVECKNATRNVKYLKRYRQGM